MKPRKKATQFSNFSYFFYQKSPAFLIQVADGADIPQTDKHLDITTCRLSWPRGQFSEREQNVYHVRGSMTQTVPVFTNLYCCLNQYSLVVFFQLVGNFQYLLVSRNCLSADIKPLSLSLSCIVFVVNIKTFNKMFFSPGPSHGGEGGGGGQQGHQQDSASSPSASILQQQNILYQTRGFPFVLLHS